MKIEIWSDVICPWCGIGQARLDAALAAFAHAGDVEVVHRSFQLAAWKRAYTAYFGEGRSIFDAESLVALGADLGLPEAEVRAALASPPLHAKVANDGKEARALGCTGVPFVVIDRKFGISGAQPVATFRAALEKAWSERAVPLVVDGGGDASCGPDGCTLP